jgi:hypothetical protein
MRAICRYGKITSKWKSKNNQFILALTIPRGTKATVIIPGKRFKKLEINPGKFHLTSNMNHSNQND